MATPKKKRPGGPSGQNTITAHHAAQKAWIAANRDVWKAAKGDSSARQALRSTMNKSVNQNRPKGGWNPSDRAPWPPKKSGGTTSTRRKRAY